MTRTKKIFTAALVPATLAAALFFLVPRPCLRVAGESGPVFFLPFSAGEAFAVSYVHSVEKTPVLEIFTVGEGGRLLLTATEYSSLGVGLPFLEEEGKLVSAGGRFVLTGQSRSFQELCLRVSPVAQQALLYRGRRIDLNGPYPPGTPVRIRADRRPAAEMFWREIADGRSSFFGQAL
ncbi:MAG: DUF1850 domain-containing protein [Desulfotomaculales bacterium]